MRSKTTWDNFDRPTDPPESYYDDADPVSICGVCGAEYVISIFNPFHIDGYCSQSCQEFEEGPRL